MRVPSHPPHHKALRAPVSLHMRDSATAQSGHELDTLSRKANQLLLGTRELFKERVCAASDDEAGQQQQETTLTTESSSSVKTPKLSCSSDTSEPAAVESTSHAVASDESVTDLKECDDAVKDASTVKPTDDCREKELETETDHALELEAATATVESL